jgi:hypothetical protein
MKCSGNGDGFDLLLAKLEDQTSALSCEDNGDE